MIFLFRQAKKISGPLGPFGAEYQRYKDSFHSDIIPTKIPIKSDCLMINHDQESEVKSIRSRKPFPPFNPMSNGPMSNGSTNGSQTTSPGQFEFLPQARFPAHSLGW